MNDTLLAELTRLAHGASPEARAWIGRRIHEDNESTRRGKGRQRGVAVRFPKGGKGVLSEAYVRENGIQVADHDALRTARHRGNSSTVGRMTREAIAAARSKGAPVVLAEEDDGSAISD